MGLPILFLGLWNFSFKGYVNINFNFYWLIVSFLIVATNVFLLNLLAKKRFFYLLQVAIYSLIVSTAFTLTNDSNFRLIILAILNLIFYLSEGLFTIYKKEVRYVSRIVNLILNLAIFLTIIYLIPFVPNNYQKVLSILALLIPTFFISLAFVKENAHFDASIELILFVGKCIIIGNFFNVSGFNVLSLLGIILIFYILLGEFVFRKKSKNCSTSLLSSIYLFL